MSTARKATAAILAGMILALAATAPAADFTMTQGGARETIALRKD